MKLAGRSVCDDALALRWAQAACFAAGIAIFPVAISGLARMGPSRVEMLLGCLATSAVSIGAVAMGLILGVTAELRRR
jgi:exosortase/archaeosortase